MCRSCAHSGKAYRACPPLPMTETKLLVDLTGPHGMKDFINRVARYRSAPASGDPVKHDGNTAPRLQHPVWYHRPSRGSSIDWQLRICPVPVCASGWRCSLPSLIVPR